MDVKHDESDQIYLIFSLLHPNPHTQLFKHRRIVNTSSSTVQEDSNIAELKREVEEYIEILNKEDFNEELDPFLFWREKPYVSRRLCLLSTLTLATPPSSSLSPTHASRENLGRKLSSV
ncbi:hypothetical protein OUZ56_003406 [Daphnia magna]|uniref:HAT C-terminal dimerisation domain-containing protein n=1 Tax=Daphnia magna TaxID=35525 RepID=A0ABR0A8M4_9CRUS|nr:hypothetical protein OUZ56_003406 [Daphnia magna]